MDLKRLQTLGMDTEEGLAYCADDPEFYEEMLGDFVAEASEKSEELRGFFAEGAWDQYRIRVHSLKNTARMVGAKALSEHAYTLEMAARDEDAEAIAAAHGPFLDECDDLTRALREFLA